MKTIYKYPLEITDMQVLNLPIHASIISIQNQKEKLYLWAIVDDDERGKESRRFRMIGTGHPIPEEIRLELLGHVQLLNGNLVFHVFEEVE